MADRKRLSTVLGLGGAASLCCLGSAAVGGPAFAGGAVAGGALAGGLGPGLAQVLVTVLTMGVLGVAWRRFGGSGGTGKECERR